MKKIIKLFCISILSFILFTNYVLAYGYDVSVTSKTVTVGNSVTLSIKVTDAAGKFVITSSNSSVVSVSPSTAWIDNTTTSITLKALKEGNATITIAANDVTSYSGNNIGGTKSINITVKAKQTTPSNGGGNSNTVTQPKSSNNYLSSITIDGLKLNETFDRETLEYSVTVPPETEKIKINAQLADSRSKVSGIGEVAVKTGLNTLNIVVTGENGSKRTYVIKATVEELKKIEVKVDSKDYTILRRRKELPEISEYFEEKDITIGEDTVEGYYNKKLDYNVVGLKDNKGNIAYYIYKDGKYTLYKEYSFNGVTVQLVDKELPNNYKKTTFIYNDEIIDSYQEVKHDLIKNTYALDNNDITGNQFYLFYAKNVETGKESLYQYDALEKTIQRYNLEVLDIYKNSSDTYYMYLLISIAVIFILVICIIIRSIISSKKKKKRN